MNFTKKDGFTLVELIVVIAILAILAGAAIPAYSGYIDRANKTGDLQLLDAMTTAFHSACIDENVSILDMEKTKVVLDADGKFTGFDFTNAKYDPTAALSGENMGTDPFTVTFKVYYGDNLDAAFKVVKNIVFKDGAFVDNDTLRGAFGQVFDKLAESLQGAVDKLNGSTFGDIGAEGLMDRLDTVTGMAAGFANEPGKGGISMKRLLNGNLDSLAKMMGYESKDDAGFKTAWAEMMNEKAAEINPSNPADADAQNAAKYELLSNYAVLAAAQSTSGKTAAELMPKLQAGIDAGTITAMLDKGEGSQDALTDAAMVYAMYTAYANSLPDDDSRKENAMKNTGSVALVATAIQNDAGFDAYLLTEQANKDLEGYLGALDIINQSTKEDKDAAQDLVTNGYDNDSLLAALEGLLGN